MREEVLPTVIPGLRSGVRNPYEDEQSVVLSDRTDGPGVLWRQYN